MADASLAGKVAVITGAGNGLGRSHALLFASLGARVVVNDAGVNLDGSAAGNAPADSVVEEIARAGGTAVADHHSVADAQSAAAMIDRAVRSFGSVDILVNNAGILRDRTFAKVPLNEFEAVMRVHYLGTVYATRAAFPIMKEQHFGRIIMTSSVAGLYGNFGQSAYGSAKLAVVGLMRTLALEGARYNVLCNAISPLAATRMGDEFYDSKKARCFRADHVSAAVAFLCDPQTHVNGEVVIAAGGHFATLRQYETAGVYFDPLRTLTAQDIRQHWEQISNPQGSLPIGSVSQAVEKAERGLSAENAT